MVDRYTARKTPNGTWEVICVSRGVWIKNLTASAALCTAARLNMEEIMKIKIRPLKEAY